MLARPRPAAKAEVSGVLTQPTAPGSRSPTARNGSVTLGTIERCGIGGASCGDDGAAASRVSRALLGRRRFLSAMKARSLVRLISACEVVRRSPERMQILGERARLETETDKVSRLMRGSLSRAAVLTQVH